MTNAPDERLRRLPPIDRIVAALSEPDPPQIVTAAARRAVETWRSRIIEGRPAPSFEEVVSSARSLLVDERRAYLRPLINATGVLIHTNLGRVPLGQRQLDAVRTVAGGYSNLEYDLKEGKRGSRYSHARRLLTALTGAESALVVNNNAAAVLLVLSALCSGREVIVSRGELVEIGGEFRLPDVMSASGAILREVGTTNRTHMHDYESAISPETAAILKVHPSNFRISGFTSSVDARSLARLARGRRVLFVNDLGSGLVEAPAEPAWANEPLVEHALADGADIVTFSGDKLLGGPQAGLILGRSEWINVLSSHPLLRAVRVDKMALAALEATLELYLEGRAQELPLWRMAGASAAELRERASSLAEAIAGPEVKAEALPIGSVTGGGSLPGAELGSWGVAIAHSERGADAVETALRASDPPVITRIEGDRVILDMRTVEPSDDEALRRLVAEALR